MKKLGWALVGAFFLLYFFSKRGNDEGPNQSKTNSNKSYSVSGNDEALKLINAEPKVREAIITEANVLYASVEDDGTNRDGYAAYLCEILREKKAKANRVKIVKVNSTNDPNKQNSYGVLLGESWCR